jgi:hypothetical protein
MLELVAALSKEWASEPAELEKMKETLVESFNSSEVDVVRLYRTIIPRLVERLDSG